MNKTHFTPSKSDLLPQWAIAFPLTYSHRHLNDNPARWLKAVDRLVWGAR